MLHPYALRTLLSQIILENSRETSRTSREWSCPRVLVPQSDQERKDRIGGAIHGAIPGQRRLQLP